MDGPRFRWTSSARSDVGLVRRINEDACLALPERGLWAVADGMGGHSYGEVASAMVIDALASLAGNAGPATLDALAEAVQLALQVVNHALREQAIMHDVALVGTTVVVLLAQEDFCAVLWAGDSRAYRMRGGSLQQLTHDHSQANLATPALPVPAGFKTRTGAGIDAGVEAGIDAGIDDGVDAGVEARITDGSGHAPLQDGDDLTWYAAASEAPAVSASAITRAVGAADALVLDEIRFSVEDGDVLLLCSDGLSRDVDAVDIARTLAPGNSRHATQSLVALALQQGGRDNVSVVVVECEDLWSADRTQLNPAC